MEILVHCICLIPALPDEQRWMLQPETHSIASQLFNSSFRPLCATRLVQKDLCINKNRAWRSQQSPPISHLTVSHHPLLELMTLITAGPQSISLEPELHWWRDKTAESLFNLCYLTFSNTPAFGTLGIITRDIAINNDSSELLPQWPRTEMIFSSGACFKRKLNLDFTNAIKSSEHLLCKGKSRLHIHRVLNLHQQKIPYFVS